VETMTAKSIWERALGGGLTACFEWLAISLTGSFAETAPSRRHRQETAVTEEADRSIARLDRYIV